MKVSLNGGYFVGLYALNDLGVKPKTIIGFGTIIAVFGVFLSSLTKKFLVFVLSFAML